MAKKELLTRDEVAQALIDTENIFLNWIEMLEKHTGYTTPAVVCDHYSKRHNDMWSKLFNDGNFEMKWQMKAYLQRTGKTQFEEEDIDLINESITRIVGHDGEES